MAGQDHRPPVKADTREGHWLTTGRPQAAPALSKQNEVLMMSRDQKPLLYCRHTTQSVVNSSIVAFPASFWEGLVGKTDTGTSMVP